MTISEDDSFSFLSELRAAITNVPEMNTRATFQRPAEVSWNYWNPDESAESLNRHIPATNNEFAYAELLKQVNHFLTWLHSRKPQALSFAEWQLLADKVIALVTRLIPFSQQLDEKVWNELWTDFTLRLTEGDLKPPKGEDVAVKRVAIRILETDLYHAKFLNNVNDINVLEKVIEKNKNELKYLKMMTKKK